MGVHNLKRLIAGLEVGIVPPEPADWLRLGIQQYLDGNGSLEECLGLKARQGKKDEHPRNLLKTEIRDDLYLFLASRVEGSLWEKAKTISAWLKLYHNPELRYRVRSHGKSFPPNKIPVDCFLAIRQVVNQGVKLPQSASRIDEILKKCS